MRPSASRLSEKTPDSRARALLAPTARSTNSEYYAKLATAFDTMLDHPIFQNAVGMDPLKITKAGPSGHIQPYDANDFIVTIKKKGKYTAGGNALWANPFLACNAPSNLARLCFK